jgi:hypothetical protein
MTTGGSALVPAVAAFGLPGASPELPTAPPPPDVWDDLTTALAGARVAWPLAAAVRDGALPATPEQAADAAAVHRAAVALDLVLERELLELAERLDDASIDFLVLKGPAAAHLDYPEPGMRSFGDLDVLVRSEQVEAALGLLERDGGRRRYAEPRPGYDRRFGKGASMRMPAGHEVDVHRTLAPGPYGLTIDLPQLFEGTATFRLAGRDLRALGPIPRFVHACLHAALGSSPPSLGALRDVAQLLGRDPDPTSVRDVAGRSRVEAPVALAIRMATSTFGLDRASRIAEWAADAEAGAADQRLLRAYIGQRSSAAQAIEGFRVIPGARDRLAYARSIVFPRADPRRRAAGERWRRGLHYLRARG